MVSRNASIGRVPLVPLKKPTPEKRTQIHTQTQAGSEWNQMEADVLDNPKNSILNPGIRLSR